MISTVDKLSPDVAVLTLDGELDASNYRDLIEQGQRLYADGVRRLVLDMSALTYMSSSGIVALHSLALVFRGKAAPDPELGWAAFHAVSSDDGSGAGSDAVRIAGATGTIASNLERTGLDRILPMYVDRAAALAG